MTSPPPSPRPAVPCLVDRARVVPNPCRRQAALPRDLSSARCGAPPRDAAPLPPPVDTRSRSSPDLHRRNVHSTPRTACQGTSPRPTSHWCRCSLATRIQRTPREAECCCAGCSSTPSHLCCGRTASRRATATCGTSPSTSRPCAPCCASATRSCLTSTRLGDVLSTAACRCCGPATTAGPPAWEGRTARAPQQRRVTEGQDAPSSRERDARLKQNWLCLTFIQLRDGPTGRHPRCLLRPTQAARGRGV